MLSSSKIEEVSQTCFVLDVVKFKKGRSLAELFRFSRCLVKKLRSLAELFRFWPCQVQNLRTSRRIHLIALAAETKVAAKEFLNSLISPQNSRNFPAFTCFPCLICCKTGACRDVAVSFHIRLGYGTETRMQYVFEIGLRHTHLFNMCGKDTMFWFGAPRPRCKESRRANWCTLL